MVKLDVKGVHPETKEETIHSFEGDAVCTVSVKENQAEGRVEVASSIMGNMDTYLVEAMVGGLIKACKEILNDFDPIVGAMILSRALNKEEEETDGMAGESSEPERPTEQ